MSDEEPMEFENSFEINNDIPQNMSANNASDVPMEGTGMQNAEDPKTAHAYMEGNRNQIADGPESTHLDINPTDDKRPQPNAPLKTDKVKIKVDWKGQRPDKWDKSLHKALQTWCNSNVAKLNGPCEVYNVTVISDDPLCAEVQIIPPEVLKGLKNKTTIPLKFKDFKDLDVIATIFLDEPMQDLKDPSPKVSSTMTSSAANVDATAENNASIQSETIKTVEMNTETTLGGFSVPLYQYWYMHHAYRKELEKIETEHGVTISAEVLVSFKSTQHTSPDSLCKASEKLQILFKGCVADFGCAFIPCTHMDSNIVTDTMHDSQIEEAKIMMNVSARNIQVFGPRNFTVKINTKVDTTRLENQMTDKSVVNGSKMELDNSVSRQHRSFLDIDTKDLHTQLEMDKVHWDLMKRSSKEQILNLETKYGVSFYPEEVKDNSIIRIKAQSKEDQHTDLENHALRALMQCYQKLITATVSCELKDPKDAGVIAQIKQILGTQHYYVAAVDAYGPWRLVGLPEHLGPSIADIEKKTAMSVFDDKTKKLIGYAWDIPQERGITWENTSTYGQGAFGGPQDEAVTSRGQETDTDFNGKSQERANKNSSHDNKGAHGKKEQCVICMDSIKNNKKLKCGHEFCRDCIRQSVEILGSICPVCKKVFGRLEGNQPDGTMDIRKVRTSLPGYPHSGTIEISYYIPGGIQTNKHPNPGQAFSGASRTAYLPDNKDGNHILTLLKRAFDQRLIFTVGTSTTSGATNTVTWNDIHHKTNIHGGPAGYGYPDPDYLKRVKDELKAKGIE